jgi:two-component system, NarL family, nitrate/nitrite response regulator NarL
MVRSDYPSRLARRRPVTARKRAVPTRVLIVDDHPLFLEGIGMLVDRLDDVELVGRCDSGAAGIRALEEQEPDLVVLDFQLGDMTGLDVLARITERRLPTRVLFVSGRLQGDDAYRLVEGGAVGVIEKDATFDEIADAITRVARGETVMSPRVQSAIMTGVRERRDRQAPVILSDRELEILDGLARGLTAPAIGRELNLSGSTIKSHLQRLYDKLGVSDRAAAVAEAMRRDLIH